MSSRNSFDREYCLQQMSLIAPVWQHTNEIQGECHSLEMTLTFPWDRGITCFTLGSVSEPRLKKIRGGKLSPFFAPEEEKETVFASENFLCA